MDISPPSILFSDSRIFNFALENLELEENFKKAFFYKTGSLKEGKNSAVYFTQQLSKLPSEQIFAQTYEQKAIDIMTSEITSLTSEECVLAQKARQNNDSSFIINANKESKDDYLFSYNLYRSLKNHYNSDTFLY